MNGWALWERWDLVFVSVIVHALVLFFFLGSSFIKPKKVDFRSKGMLVGFLVALYFEMYGLPLTIFLLQPLLSEYVIAMYPVALPLRILGSVMIMGGFVMIYLGWKKIHAIGDQVVQSGIYAHIRHPQYAGLALLTLGQIVQWPTITGIICWPLLVWIYVKLAKREERDAEARFGQEYVSYKLRVPGFIPGWIRVGRQTAGSS